MEQGGAAADDESENSAELDAQDWDDVVSDTDDGGHSGDGERAQRALGGKGPRDNLDRKDGDRNEGGSGGAGVGGWPSSNNGPFIEDVD